MCYKNEYTRQIEELTQKIKEICLEIDHLNQLREEALAKAEHSATALNNCPFCREEVYETTNGHGAPTHSESGVYLL